MCSRGSLHCAWQGVPALCAAGGPRFACGREVISFYSGLLCAVPLEIVILSKCKNLCLLEKRKAEEQIIMSEENANASMLYGLNMDLYDDEFEEYKKTNDYKLSVEESKRAEMVKLAKKLCVSMFKLKVVV